MTIKSTTPRYVTKARRTFCTELEVPDELLEFWRAKYETIFAAECKARRIWAGSYKKSPEDVEATIATRQVEWDAYVAEKLADIATARPA